MIGVSEPHLENSNDAYSIPFKKFISLQNNEGFNSTKVSSFYLSVKLYIVYILTKKEKESQITKKDRKSSQLIGTRFDDDNNNDEEIETNSNHKNTKLDKLQLIEDTASATSAQTGSNYSGGISSIGIRNKKKDNIYEYGGFNKIKKLNFLTIFVAVILLIFEYFYLRTLESNSLNNNTSLLLYREFTKLYFQLFSSILAVTCIYDDKNKNCIRLVDVFVNQYYGSKKNENFFDYALFIMIQNEVLARQILEKRNSFVSIHKIIGTEKYNELFNQKIDYLRVTQNMNNEKINFNVTTVSIQFSEAILILCNSFQLLSEKTNSSIIFLNKTKDPFSFLNSQNDNNPLDDYQKNLYEMILNYKYFYDKFLEINDKLYLIIMSKSDFIHIFAYIYISLDTLLLIIIGILMIIYTISFETILIKIINYINMTLNIKNDGINFSQIFTKKIENLETILQFYKSDPTKSVQKLNILYNSYQLHLTSKNKANNAIEINKKSYKKTLNENKTNELDNIPKNQRIITRKDIRNLGITSIFIFMFLLNLFLILVLYVLLIIIWNNFFSKKENLFSLINKTRQIEITIYRAMNSYDLMFFHNFTIDEITEILLPDKKNEKNALFRSFYDDLKSAFESKKEKNKIGDLYQDFQDKINFTCENLFEYNNDFINNIENDDCAKDLKNIRYNLISSCEITYITESNDYRTVFERLIQYIRNGLISVNNFTYSGLINHINDGILSRISIFFGTTVYNIIEITNTIPHKEAINNLIKKMNNIIIISEIIFLIYDIIAILFVFILYIPGINKLCNQIYILRKIFKILEIEE